MTDLATLRALLPHWIEHNAEHAAEFQKWVERMRTLEQEHIAEHLAMAITKMEAANRDLQGALAHLDGLPDTLNHDHTHHNHV